MAYVDIDPFGEHESRPEKPTEEHIPLDLRKIINLGTRPRRARNFIRRKISKN